MSRKKHALAVSATGIVLILGFGLKKNDRRNHLDEKTSAIRPAVLKGTVTRPEAAPTILNSSTIMPTVNPWDYHKPLTVDERREFEGVETQVRKFITWGKMDPEAVPAFRQTLFKIGDRAVADLARQLSQISRDDLQDRVAAEAVVHRIDELAYFADSSNPLAADSVAALAKRPVNWGEAGELLNPVKANITFEMFDIYSKTRPSEAAAFIASIEKRHRTAYFTHYAYGRKLAGKTLEDIDLELKAVFGSPELALK